MAAWMSSKFSNEREDSRSRDAHRERDSRRARDENPRRENPRRENSRHENPRHEKSNSQGSHDQRSSQRSRMTGSSAVAQAKKHLLDLTGQACETVSSITRRPDGGWNVQLEVVELERIPRTTDILASYAIQLDDQGELLGYERVNRYYRNAASGGEE